jgi:hypothetical protein
MLTGPLYIYDFLPVLVHFTLLVLIISNGSLNPFNFDIYQWFTKRL